MARRRISMRKIKEVLRLFHECGLSKRKTAQICNISRPSVQEYIMRANAAGLSWPLPENMTDQQIEQKLYTQTRPKHLEKELIPYEYLYQEIRRPNVTLSLLWEEYKQNNPEGYQYSQFCNLFRTYSKKLNYSMRQEHKAGEKLFVDFGEGLNLVDPKTGEKIPTRLFVAVWGASNYTYAAATLDEGLYSWIKVNKDALEYFDCCPKVIVPDNLKSAVSKACRYEPDINPTYAEFAAHYSVAILPARPYKPKDKAHAENGVKLAKRWILARLRNKIFYSLAELNKEILKLLDKLNERVMRKINKSRKELFEILDKPHAQLLPDNSFEFAEWKKARVNINYHISFDEHDYSVPYTYIHQEIDIRATINTVEVFYKGNRICSHQRSYKKHKYTTVKEHMPPSHQKYIEWTPERILKWSKKYGESVRELVEKIMDSKKYPEQAYKSCLGIIRLEKHFSADRLNDACNRALQYNVHSYQGVKNILKNGLDQVKQPQAVSKPPQQHENIRGAGFYN